MNIIYQDKFIVVCEKPVGVVSEYTKTGNNMPDLVKKATNSYKIDVLHRLDKDVGGLMVFSKKHEASADLSRQIAKHEMTKEYLAVVENSPVEPKGTFTDLLFRDRTKGKSFVVSGMRKGVKEAVLDYETVDTRIINSKTYSLVKIKLHTGRTHQIRVQFSSRKMSLMGDGKYGSKEKNTKIALWSYHLNFLHPNTKKPVDFKLLPPDVFPWNKFNLADIDL